MMPVAKHSTSVDFQTLVILTGIAGRGKVGNSRPCDFRVEPILSAQAKAEGEEWALPPPYRHVGGAMWAVPIAPALHDRTDDERASRRSRLRLFEDGHKLGPGHALHEQIDRFGGGRYSFWKSVLYFSTHDGSDPNVNGRRYTARLEIPLPLPNFAAADGGGWQSPAAPLRCAVLGLGNRGLHLASLAQRHGGVEVAWIVDNSELRLTQARERLGSGETNAAITWQAVVDDPDTDIVFITLPDHLHRAAAEAAFAAGKHVYLEKPIATTVDDARAILRAWQRSGRVLQIGYVLRQAPFYRAIRRVLRTGTLGTLRMATISEQLDVMHGASFMRRWHAQSANSGGLMVHKGCHDLDLICWLLETRPRLVASFGGVATFSGPAPAKFCSQCSERTTCAYVDDGRHESRTREEWTDPTAFGLDRCVFRDDKDIVDNQVVAFELVSGVRGSYHLAVQGPRTERRITLIGDAARLDGIFEDGRFTIDFSPCDREPTSWSAGGADAGPHGGGDPRLIHDFLNACAGREPASGGTAEEIIAGLVFAEAAETARKTGGVVALADGDFTV
jgi:predicted dehydrogenase